MCSQNPPDLSFLHRQDAAGGNFGMHRLFKGARVSPLRNADVSPKVSGLPPKYRNVLGDLSPVRSGRTNNRK